MALEPALRCVAALLSPSTGIIDSHGLMLALQGDAEAAGAMLALRSPALRAAADGARLRARSRRRPADHAAGRSVVNSAGLGAPVLARGHRAASAPGHVPPRYFAKGNYFTLSGRSPFSRLVYPVPERAGLWRAPDARPRRPGAIRPGRRWVDDLDYSIDGSEAVHFYAEVRRYWPALPDGALQPGYTGVRPKIRGPGEPAQDFRIDGPRDARRARPGQPVRHRVARPDVVAGDRRARG